MGDLLALTIAGESGDISSFRTACSSSAPFEDPARQSGQKSRASTLTRDGSTVLRQPAIEVAHQAWRPNDACQQLQLDVKECRGGGGHPARPSSRATVKRWQNPDSCLRWTAVGMLEAGDRAPRDHRPHRTRHAGLS